jgi:integrase
VFQKDSLMASLFRPTIVRYVNKDGRQVSKATPGAKRVRKKSKTWRGRYEDAKGQTKTVSLFDDKESSEAKFATILQRVREEKAGIRRPDPFEVHRETPLVCSVCNGTGCVDANEKSSACKTNHHSAFREHLNAKSNTEKHVQLTLSRLLAVLQGCRFQMLDDLNAGRVAIWLSDQRKTGMGPATSNHYLSALKTFGNWLHKDRRHPENPFAHLNRVNARVDVRCVRRALVQEELARAIEAAENGEPFRDLTGDDRSVLYLLAAFTGLRSSELASLTDRSFDFRCEPPTLTVEAACSKHRREDVLPLHPQLAARLQVWLLKRREQSREVDVIPIASRTSGEPQVLFPGTWVERAAPMLRKDLAEARKLWLEEAKTEFERQEREQSGFLLADNDDGKADFHALRHTFISNLASNGVHPKLAKELARHSTITLTMDRYSHVGLLDMNGALECLPNVPNRSEERQRAAATGTESVSVAPKVALDPVQLRNYQESSRKTAAAGDDSSDSRNMSSQEELSEDLTSPEKWWRGELNPRPAGYESAALTN